MASARLGALTGRIAAAWRSVHLGSRHGKGAANMAELRGRALMESRYGPLGCGAQVLAIGSVDYTLAGLLFHMGLDFEDSRGIDLIAVSVNHYVVRYYDGQDERIVAYEFDGELRFFVEFGSPIAEREAILVETGGGAKWDDKQRDICAFEGEVRLTEQLAQHGVRPEQIDLVINTHLHFYHCGWNTRRVDGKVIPTFPSARYVVQRGELEHAKRPTERDRASYIPDNFLPVEAARQWWLLEGHRGVAPGVELIRVPGHTGDLQCVRLSGGGKTAFSFVDLVPTTAHLPYPWIMAYRSDERRVGE